MFKKKFRQKFEEVKVKAKNVTNKIFFYVRWAEIIFYICRGNWRHTPCVRWVAFSKESEKGKTHFAHKADFHTCLTYVRPSDLSLNLQCQLIP